MRHPVISGCLAAAFAVATAQADDRDDRGVRTATPVKHLVVIFQENISYDHYFGTYPRAQNNPGETPFKASKHTPINNNLLTPLDVNNGFTPLVGVNLLTNNPNSNPNAPLVTNNLRHNGTDAANPFRLSPSQASTADQGHNDMPEQAAYNNGQMDGFPAWVGTAGGTATNGPLPPPAAVATKGLTMGYYDGNTVTAFWNYAQHYAMNDNSYSSQFGPSSPGALNLISGQANGFSHATNVHDGSGNLLHPTHEAFGDASHTPEQHHHDRRCRSGAGRVLQPHHRSGHRCTAATSATCSTVATSPGAGSRAGSTCRPSTRTAAPAARGSLCRPSRTSRSRRPITSRITSLSSTTPRPATRPTRGRPRSRRSGRATSQAPTRPSLRTTSTTPTTSSPRSMAGNLPSVSFLKAPAFQDGHAGYSNPIDEQAFIVKAVNAVQKSKFWKDTAIVILYDDSDGWYDHQMPPIVNPSFNPNVDVLNAPGVCNLGLQQGRPTRTTPLNGAVGQPAWGRCGYGTRQPLLVISPFAKRNHIDHTLTDQTSVLRFIEDNWLSGERIQQGGSFDTIAGTIEHMFDFDDRRGNENDRKLILDPSTGAIVFNSHRDDDNGDDHDHDRH